jgi:TrpR-related protein YerC/YecD
MKKRSIEPETPIARAEESLCRALLSLDSVAGMRAFLRDLCTPSELEALTDRWRVVPYILKEMPYREIHDRTAVSITTIGRVARFLSQGSGGYLAALSQAELAKATKPKKGSPSRSRSLKPHAVSRGERA